MNADLKPVKVRATIFYPKDLSVINTTFDPEAKKYACTLGELSDAACQALEGIGIKIKEKETTGKHIVGKSLFKFEPVDVDGNGIDAARIGSGTRVEALVSAYRHKLSGKHGAAPSIKKLIVIDLKEYNPAGSTADDEAPAL